MESLYRKKRLLTNKHISNLPVFVVWSTVIIVRVPSIKKQFSCQA